MKSTPRLLLSGLVALLLFPVALVAQQANTLTFQEKKDGWVLLFDGLSTTGWTTPWW